MFPSSGGGVFHQRHGRNGTNMLISMLNFRTLIIVITVFLFIILFYYYNESQEHLTRFELEKEKCQQNLDSVSAQLQVVYEHKSRLEKSLLAEKDRNAKTKEEKEIQWKTFKEKTQTDLQNAEKRYKLLQEHNDELKKQFDEIQGKYNVLKQDFITLKDEKQTNDEKHEEILRKTQNRAVEVEQQFEDLTKEAEKLREENAQMKKFMKKSLELPSAAAVSETKTTTVVSIDAAKIETAHKRESVVSPVSDVLSDLNGQRGLPTANVSTSIGNIDKISVEIIPPPFHQVPNLTSQSQFNSSRDNQSGMFQSDKQQAVDMIQIQKPFADSHQEKLMENAKFPPVGGAVADSDQQPVLQNPMGEDQQNRLAKPGNILPENQGNRKKDSKVLIDNIVNRRSFDDQAADDDDEENGAKRKPVPVPHDADDGAVVGAGRAPDIVFKRDEVQQAGARMLKEPKEYEHAGVVGGGGDKGEEENDEYKDEEEEKKFKEAAI